jgi:hypothetical protein
MMFCRDEQDFEKMLFTLIDDILQCEQSLTGFENLSGLFAD